jgi:hypothetical protein
MDIKHTIFEPGKTFISRHILHQHWYTCPIALPVRRKPQHRSLLTLVSATSAPPFQPLRHQRIVCHQGGFLVDQQMEVTRVQVRPVRRMFKKFPVQFLNSVLGCSGRMRSGIVMMSCHSSYKLASTFSANCIQKIQHNFTVRCIIYIFTTLLKMG